MRCARPMRGRRPHFAKANSSATAATSTASGQGHRHSAAMPVTAISTA